MCARRGHGERLRLRLLTKDRPFLSSEDAPRRQTVKFMNTLKIWSWAPGGFRHQDGQTDWRSFNVIWTWAWTLSLFFYPDDKGNTFPPNVRKNLLNYSASYLFSAINYQMWNARNAYKIMCNPTWSHHSICLSVKSEAKITECACTDKEAKDVRNWSFFVSFVSAIEHIDIILRLQSNNSYPC
jgi:hypothetical protein